MAWQSQITLMLRHMLNDLDSANYTYTDSRLQQAATVSAQLILTNHDFAQDYSVDIANSSISPDPSDLPDNDFITLLCLKTACVILGSEIKAEASNSIAIKDGPSSIDLRGVSNTLNLLLREYCTRYEQASVDYSAGNSIAGQAILGPYSPGSDFVARTHSDYDHRGNYFRY
jgi:hypothetical protein